MIFYVIYEFDVVHGGSVKPYNPPFKAKGFHLTECGESEFCSSRVIPGKHRKYAGFLSKPQFKALVSAQALRMEPCETMGSLTMELGHIPAVAFNGDDMYNYDVSQSAYVTPLIERKRPCDDRDWDRAAAALQSMYA